MNGFRMIGLYKSVALVIFILLLIISIMIIFNNKILIKYNKHILKIVIIMKIGIVLGTRPEIIKMAPVIDEIKEIILN